jgi:hypothetical protein
MLLPGLEHLIIVPEYKVPGVLPVPWLHGDLVQRDEYPIS